MKCRIAHFTDLHIGASSAMLAGTDPLRRLEVVLEDIALQQVDYMWLTGDLTDDTPTSADIYQQLKQRLDEMSIPYIVVPGNHDDPSLLSSTFHPSRSRGALCYGELTIAGRLVICLDSSRGRLTTRQWAWLEEVASRTVGSAPLILMHHPPTYAHGCFMDNHYPFIEQDRFMDIISRWTGAHVFCGHYHHQAYLTQGHCHVHIAPSTLFQVDMTASDFTADTDTWGYNLITLSDEDHLSVYTRQFRAGV